MLIEKNSFITEQYWKPEIEKKTGLKRENVTTHVRELFLKAVEKRLISDVPLAAFLSGGIDSSAIVAAMKECGVTPNTFNINFSEERFSEARYARLIADKFKTNHTEVNIEPSYFLSQLPEAVKAMDHPSIDGINTYVVSKATKQAGISVALSGVGGDEWFGGYPVFRSLKDDKLKMIKWMPRMFRKAAIQTVELFDNTYADDKRIELLLTRMQGSDIYMTYRKVFTDKQISKLLVTSKPKFEILGTFNTISKISIAEWHYYLLPVLLRDTDQMGMAHSLEIREPFMDYKLIEYLLNLPDELKMGKRNKELLVAAMGDLLPEEIFNRPKMGFVLPYEIWMKNELKDFVQTGLNILKANDAFDGNNLSNLENSFFNDVKSVKWHMIWSLTILGHWINNNGIR